MLIDVSMSSVLDVYHLLVGIVTGMSKAEGSGIALVSGVLGTGLVAQLVVGFLLALDVNSVLIVLAGFAAGLVPFIVLAFRRFDVARDTPP